MKNFSDLPDTDLRVRIQLASVRGAAQTQIIVNDSRPIVMIPTAAGSSLQYQVACRDPLVISIEFQGPDNSAANIVSVQVDDFDFVPGYTQWATYHGTPTTYLDTPGRWEIRLGEPFYCWLHRVTGQGWLFD